MPDFFKPELERVSPEWTPDAPERIGAFFTCRTGGVSSGPWGGPEGIMGFNLADHTGDNRSCVRMNRSILAQMLPSEPKWLRQVHGTEIVCADGIDPASPPEADASWTKTPGVVCCVMTADCLPVLLADKRGRIAAAVHAGWRSLAGGIIQKTVETLCAEVPGLAPADLRAWFGPRIGEADFEVGPDVLEAMKAHLPEAEAAFRPAAAESETEGKLLCSLAALARQALALSGVPAENAADCALSTYAEPQRFYSFRRDGEKSGRHAAVIWIEPEGGAPEAAAASPNA